MPITRTYKTIGFSVPPGIAAQIDDQAKKLQLTKSEFFRDMFRAWQEKKERDQAFEALVMKAMAEVKKEKQTNPKTPKEILADVQDMAETLSARAKTLGLEITEAGDILQKPV
ncbi:MAG: hypothetical protein V9G98_27790 [Candidatus Competibacter sp.]